MKETKRQTDLQFIGYISKYGCFFLCMTYWLSMKKGHGELGYDFLNVIWMDAIKKGIISGDENRDGDMDDKNELLILDKNRLLTLVGIDLKYLGSFEPGNEPKGKFYIGEFYNQRTGFIHFAAIDENHKVEYDPIFNSVTVKEGILKTVRVFG